MSRKHCNLQRFEALGMNIFCKQSEENTVFFSVFLLSAKRFSTKVAKTLYFAVFFKFGA